jgi:type IV pilus assembly protein PilC
MYEDHNGAVCEILQDHAVIDGDVENAVTAMTSIIEPVMIVVLAVLIGGIVIALFLPIINIIQHLSG